MSRRILTALLAVVTASARNHTRAPVVGLVSLRYWRQPGFTISAAGLTGVNPEELS